MDRAQAALRHPATPVEVKAELVALLVLEHEQPIDDAILAALDHWRSPLVSARVALARGVRGGVSELRGAIAALDAADLGPDAARARTLLALRSGSVADREDAERHLRRIGDLLFLEKLV